MNLSAPIIAAVIVSFTTFFTVVINVWSARIARSEDRREKNQEWLRDKQIRDVEEIIPTLTMFLYKLFDSAREINVNQGVEVDTIWFDLETLKKHQEDEVMKAYTKQETVETLEDHLRVHEKAVKDFVLDISKRNNWFLFDSNRLCIWLNEPEEISEEFTKIRKLFAECSYNVLDCTSELKRHFYRLVQRKGELNDEDLVEAKRLLKAFEKIGDEWPVLEDEVLRLQKNLAGKYKSVEAEKPSASNDDGLLVSVARQVEKGVRWLLRLE